MSLKLPQEQTLEKVNELYRLVAGITSPGLLAGICLLIDGVIKVIIQVRREHD